MQMLSYTLAVDIARVARKAAAHVDEYEETGLICTASSSQNLTA